MATSKPNDPDLPDEPELDILTIRITVFAEDGDIGIDSELDFSSTIACLTRAIHILCEPQNTTLRRSES